jgi:carnitine O-acetyltransferase
MEWEEFGAVSSNTRSQGWQQLKWETDPHIREECRRVETESRCLVEDSDDSQLWFDEFGVDWMRAGKSFYLFCPSPD